jgi:murein DD-endopeptidase MepM/ murein hydrolase activator NlpD
MSGRRALERRLQRPLDEVAPPVRPAKKQRSRTRSTIGSKLLSLGAMVFAGALAAGMSLPASAFGTGTDLLSAVAEPAAHPAQDELQSVEVSATAAGSSAAREEFTALSWAQMLVLKYGTRDYRYSTDWTGPIRWPFPQAVTISSGFGERAAPCAGCSSMHMGLDFQPPNDSPVYAIADGVVAFQEDDSYGYGNHVILDHGDLLKDGHDIQTLYAHMQHGSVPVGDFLGLVGMTGTATGIHMHFEVHMDGTQVDPFKWLKAYAS